MAYWELDVSVIRSNRLESHIDRIVCSPPHSLRFTVVANEEEMEAVSRGHSVMSPRHTFLTKTFFPLVDLSRIRSNGVCGVKSRK